MIWSHERIVESRWGRMISVRPWREPGDRVVDQVLGVVVERDVRLLDDHDRGVVQVGPGQGDPVLLVGLEVVARAGR